MNAQDKNAYNPDCVCIHCNGYRNAMMQPSLPKHIPPVSQPPVESCCEKCFTEATYVEQIDSEPVISGKIHTCANKFCKCHKESKCCGRCAGVQYERDEKATKSLGHAIGTMEEVCVEKACPCHQESKQICGAIIGDNEGYGREKIPSAPDRITTRCANEPPCPVHGHQESADKLRYDITYTSNRESKREKVMDDAIARYEKSKAEGTLDRDFPVIGNLSHPPSSIGWRERFDEKFSFEGDVKKIKQGFAGRYYDLVKVEEIESFIAQELEKEYQRGQEDAFAGKIQNLKTLNITETINVPDALREYFRKEGRNEAVDYIEENIDTSMDSVRQTLEAARSSRGITS